ncbi:MAG: 3-hydroxybutyryl-CoA dehydrogenase [Desulfobacteraceae bacterium]|nr:3-hydroxybutyryl-CoA dehydrogenase [Desulfobacteraceae bacterium]
MDGIHKGIQKVGVVGFGIMGSGIAQICAQAGYETYVSEIEKKLIDQGLERIERFLEKSVEKKKISLDDKQAAMGRIHGASTMDHFNDCDLVIEAVNENMELKKKIFRALDTVCKEDAILATNTSSLSVIDIAKETKIPDRVAGVHFFNPVPLMKLVEIVKSIVTDDGVIERCREFCVTIGKTPIIAKDSPGFILNYLQYPFRLNAIRMVENGIASKEDIDAAAKFGLGHPMGPLELQDMVGLDTTLSAVDDIYNMTKDPNFAPPMLMRKMVSAGWLGKKTGKGFYEYDENGKKILTRELIR